MGKIINNIINKSSYNRESSIVDNLNLIDNWDQKQFFYLRRNNKNRTIAVWDRGNMSQLSDTEVCINFVADAFADFQTHYREKVVNGLKPFMDMKSLKAEKAYVRPIAAYLEHQKRLEALLLENVLVPDASRINTFEDYMVYFDKFVREYGHRYPILYSTFVNSHYCSLYSTGLMIELASHGHDSDEKRVEALNDDSLTFFVDLAKEYGFTVPKQAPWCIVANLDSQAMRNYAIEYNALTKKEIMKEYFYECKNHDIDLLKGLIFNGLEALQEKNPLIEINKVCKNGKLKKVTSSRNMPETKTLFDSMSSRHLLRMYIETLLVERRVKIEKLKLDILFEECYYMLEKYSFDIAYTFIEMKILETRPDRIR